MKENIVISNGKTIAKAIGNIFANNSLCHFYTTLKYLNNLLTQPI